MTADQPTRRGRYECARCDWRAPRDSDLPGVELHEHAALSGHPLCTVCNRSLEDTDPVVCETCITRARKTLTQIVELYALLPEQLGRPAGQSPGGRRGGGDGAPLPGGAALVLLGPGSTGTEPRRLTSKEQLLGVEGREHGEDNKERDLVSVAFALHTWEIDWRDTRGEPEPDGHGTVVGAAGYLERRMRWAANGERTHPAHPAFPDFVQELSDLRDLLEQATSRRNDPERAPVPCLDCDSTSLRRVYRAADRCEHPRPSFSLSPTDEEIAANRAAARLAGETYEPPSIEQRRRRRDAMVAAWEADHAHCDQGGLVQAWACRLCERTYTDEEYRMAQADWMRHVASTREWGRPWEVAASLGLPVETVRTWVKRQQLAASCSVKSRRIEVWWPDAHELADAIRARAAARAAAQAAAADRRRHA
jgi:hypothetical protein